MNIIHGIRTNATVHAIAWAIFCVSSITLLVIMFFEAVLPGYFTNWFNPIWCLIIGVISGILTIANKHYD